MRQWFIIFVFIVLHSVKDGVGMEWNFGEVTPKVFDMTSIIAYIEGWISVFTYTTDIKIEVPLCYKLVNVKVEVVNVISTPDVYFLTHKNTVEIHYSWYQVTMSKYYVTARGIVQRDCVLGVHSLGTVWEFGQDNRKSIVVSSSDGEIGLDQKSIHVALTEPACYETVYVRVEVKNELATPSVSYTKDTNTVAISYSAKQSSLSEYKVVSKAIQQIHCR